MEGFPHFPVNLNGFGKVGGFSSGRTADETAAIDGDFDLHLRGRGVCCGWSTTQRSDSLWIYGTW